MDRHSGNRFNMHRAKKAAVKGGRPTKVAEKTPYYTPENDSNEILPQVIGLTCSGQTGRIHRADFDVWGLAE
jgi:hypothetical protein